MAITFPNNPIEGDTTIINGKTFVYDGIGWRPQNLWYANQIPIREESTAFTLTEADGFRYIAYTGADDITVTVPNSLLVGQPITIRQVGAGVITFVGDTDVVLNGNAKTAGQHTSIQIMKRKDLVIDMTGGVL